MLRSANTVSHSEATVFDGRDAEEEALRREVCCSTVASPFGVATALRNAAESLVRSDSMGAVGVNSHKEACNWLWLNGGDPWYI